MLTFAVCASLLAAPGPTVVVLYFDNNSSNREYDVLQKGLADMLITDLVTQGLAVVEREKLQALVAELDLQRTRFFDPATAQRIGKGLGATHAVTGSIAAIDPQLRLDVRLIEVSTGAVIAADKVTGAKDRFFELEEELVRKFVAGLKLQPGGAVSARVKDLSTVMAFSSGLDASDRGDFAAASSQLARVISTTPDFPLARHRYAEFLRRLHSAAKVRQDLLTNSQEQLLQNADRVLARRNEALQSEREGLAYFGYRWVRGAYIASLIQKRRVNYAVPADKEGRAEMLRLMQAYFWNQRQYAEDEIYWLKRYPRRTLYEQCWIAPADRKRADELRLEAVDTCFGYRNDVGIDTAVWAMTGDAKRGMPSVKPTLYQLDPTHGEKALKLIEQVVRDAELHPAEVTSIGWAYDAKAKVLRAMGRREEAMVAWQTILDRYPTHRLYQEYEKQLKQTLGLGPELEALEAAIGTCAGYADAFDAAVYILFQSGGVALLEQKVDAIEKRCGSKKDPEALYKVFFSAALTAINQAHDCGFARRMQARLRLLAPQYSTYPDWAKDCGG